MYNREVGYLSAPTKRDDGVDVVAILNLMEDLVPGAKAQYIDDVFTLDLPTVGHQRTLTRLLSHLVVPDSLQPIHKLLVTDGEAWIVPDIIVISRTLASGQDTTTLWPAELSLMVEVMSPTSEPFDRGPKRQFAERHGIDYWIVAPGNPWKWIEYMPYGGGVVNFPLTTATEDSA